MLRHPPNPLGPPPPPADAKLDLGDGLERDEELAPGEQRGIQLEQRASRADKVGAEDVGVDDDRRRSGSHALSRERFEEGRFFLFAEIIEHRLLGWSPGLGARQLFLDREFEVLAWC